MNDLRILNSIQFDEESDSELDEKSNNYHEESTFNE
jgi:hypothetical protein